MTLPTLYKKDARGKTRIWTIEVLGQTITTKYGLEDGKLTEKEDYIEKGKNIGKVNETTPEEQAKLQAESAWDKQKLKGYRETPEEINKSIIAPMKPLEFNKAKHRLTSPIYIQPKINGIRCLITRTGQRDYEFISNGNKDYFEVFKHCDIMMEALSNILPLRYTIDGEFYHPDWPLNKIRSATAKFHPDKTPKLEYWVFDLPITSIYIGLPFSNRIKNLKELVSDRPQHPIVLCPTLQIPTAQNLSETVKIMNKQFVEDGFEGVIIRDGNGTYRHGERTAVLQKYKEFKEEKFPISDITVEETTINGIYTEAIMYVCDAEKGTFKCRPKGSKLERRKLLNQYRNGEFNPIGKHLRVRFFEYTGDEGGARNMPQFPIGLEVEK